MHFERVNLSHVIPLLEFEADNKHYFEQYIAPREDAFYSLEGVASHITELDLHAQGGRAHSLLLFDGQQIIARANLKNITNQKAEIGYRVAMHATGRGVASLCVSHLCSEAKNMRMERLFAEVMDNNSASERVLLNSGFSAQLCYIKKHYHAHQRRNSVLYHKYVT
jgi:ribosomal-protein-alanine N-acetyltransferase